MINEFGHTTRTSRLGKTDAGFTLMEIMFTAGVVVTGMVMLMGSAVNVATQSKASEIRSQALQFNMSVLESLRGRSLDGLLQFNSDGSELEISEAGYINLHGLGDAQLQIEYVQPGDGDAPSTFVSLPLSAEQMTALDQSTLPNPLEVRVTLSVAAGANGPTYNFHSSALLGF